VVLAVLPAFEADFDEDGDVDADDLAAWRGGFGTVGAKHSEGDADGNEVVDGADFLVWQRQVGSVAASMAAVAVPEPAGPCLACFAGLMLTRMRRRRTAGSLPRRRAAVEPGTAVTA
jgi:hypothetical protein